MRGVWRSQKVQVGGGGAGARTSIVGETYQPARDGVRRGVPEQVLQGLWWVGGGGQTRGGGAGP